MIDFAQDPSGWLFPTAVWQSGGFWRRDPMFGTQSENWSFWTDDGLCGCGRGCSFWASLYPPLPPDFEFPSGEAERCVQEPLPEPDARVFKPTRYFGAATTAWRLSTLSPPRPLWWNYRRSDFLWLQSPQIQATLPMSRPQ